MPWLVAQQRSKSGIARYGYRGPERRISGYRERRRGTGTRFGAAVAATPERVNELGTEARERMQQLRTRAREQTRRVGTRLERMIDENPLAMAAGAMVLGLAVGLVLPGTRREDELMGSARDQLVDRGQKTVERVTEAAGEARRRNLPAACGRQRRTH